MGDRRTAAWRLTEFLVIPLARLLVGTRLHRADRVPRSGAFILAPNHTSDIDPVVVGLALYRAGRLPRFLAKASMFRAPVLGGFMRSTGMIPVERGVVGGAGRGGDPIAAARRLVDAGSAVIIYPEGTLTRDPELWPMRGKNGAARLALAAGVPVVPAAHWGEQRILPRYAKRPRFLPRTTVDVLFGEPVDLSAFAGRPLDDATLSAATLAIMQAVTGLVEELRGETAPSERWDPAAHGQTEFGRPTD
ncbi:lysophospholipid acyltransferase family protein [Pseudolysinimonas sp.]|uniref:lysophospholipid acyltransferase family protein n=1 Tax=Pseudolysinimonas sp. TaxID=2680009 RepID=UPI003F803339